jgi:hypothetical protein
VDLIGDLYNILFTGWTMSEEKFLFAFFALVVLPIIAEIRDRWAD